MLTDTAATLMAEAAHLRRQNRIAEAIAAYRTIVMRFPKFADAWYNLAVLQRNTFQFDQALRSYDQALAAGITRPEEVHLNRGVIFSDFRRDYAAAAAELQQALTLNPGYTPALMNLANLQEDFGRRPEASSLYARILALQPHNFEALARFANLQLAENVDPSLIARLRAALAAAVQWRDRASLGFALGRLLDAVGEYREAFAVYSAANQASFAAAGAHVARYDRSRQERFIDRMIQDGIPAARAAAAGAAPRPIFIVGMFRSGSTLAEQLLAGVPGVAAGGEMDALPRLIDAEITPFFETLASISRERIEQLAAAYRGALASVSATSLHVTDKRPDNFLYIGLIKSLFPDAKIVHTTRAPLDNCLSIFFLHLEQQMSYALNLMDIGHYFREYRRLMAHWKTLYPHDIFDFDYDALVHDPQRQMRQLCDFLGVAWSGELPQVALRSAAIRTASVWQVREPLHTRSSGRARHYAEDLGSLRSYLANLT